MAKDRKKLVHIHSNITDKQPRPEALEVGEIAVNNGWLRNLIKRNWNT